MGDPVKPTFITLAKPAWNHLPGMGLGWTAKVMTAPKSTKRPSTLMLNLRQGEVPLLGHATVGELCAHACAYATLLVQLAQVPPRKRRSFDWDRGAENEESRRVWDWGRVVRGPRHAC